MAKSFEQSYFRIIAEWLNSKILFSCALVSILTTALILGILSMESILFFQKVSFADFIFQTEWTPLFAKPRFGIWPLLLGTLLTSTIAMAIAIPFGILSAIYLSEFASRSTRQTVKPLLELLAGVPTVVYGYFALIIVTPLLQRWVPDLAGFNALSPGIVMGMMIIPTISSLSEDALSMVPKDLKEAAYALGARRISTIFRVVIPAAMSGISASIALGIGRALGETMIVAIAAGQRPLLTFDPRVPIETMTAFIVQVSMGDTPHGTLAYQTIFVVGGTLFMFTFSIHLIGIYLTKQFRRGF